MICSLVLYGQECGEPNGISTHPETPVNEDCSTQINTFDWRSEVYDVPYYMGANVNGQLNSPFFESNNIAVPELWDVFSFDAQDMLPEDGWELISNGITEAANLTPLNSREIAYLVLYNKFTATLRVLAAHHDIGQNDYMVVYLEFVPENELTGLLSPTHQIAQPLDESSIWQVHTNAKIPSSSPRYFFYADFPMAYDPCTCIFEDVSKKLRIKFESVNTQTLSLYGRSWAIDNNLANIVGGSNNINSNYLTNIYSNDNVPQAGSLIFNSWSGLVSHYEEQKKKASQLNEQYKAFKDLKAALDLAANIADLSGVSISTSDTTKFELSTLKNPLKLTSKFVEVLGAPLKKKLDAANSAAAATGKIRMIQSEIAFSGEINDFTYKDGFNILLPGQSNNADKCNHPTLSHLYPKYDEVLGRFALMKTPVIKTDQYPISGGNYNYKFQLDRATIDKNYLFNSAAHIDTKNTEIYGALILKAANNNDVVAYEYNVEKIASLSNEDSTIFITPFLPIECLTELTTLIQTKEATMSFYEAQLRLLIFYEFDAINSQGLKNQAFEVLTYPTEIDAEKETASLLTDNGMPIEKNLNLQSGNLSGTYFAWEEIEINGDITTNSSVEIIAPQISMVSGSIGDGITLKTGEFPISCEPLSPFDVSELEMHCNSGAYQANTARNKPITRQTSPIAYNDIEFFNAPNPFKESTELRFSITQNDEMSIIIYDILGQEIINLLPPTELRAGTHSYTLNGYSLPAGVYLATIQSHSESAIKKTIKIIKQ